MAMPNTFDLALWVIDWGAVEGGCVGRGFLAWSRGRSQNSLPLRLPVCERDAGPPFFQGNLVRDRSGVCGGLNHGLEGLELGQGHNQAKMDRPPPPADNRPQSGTALGFGVSWGWVVSG